MELKSETIYLYSFYWEICGSPCSEFWVISWDMTPCIYLGEVGGLFLQNKATYLPGYTVW